MKKQSCSLGMKDYLQTLAGVSKIKNIIKCDHEQRSVKTRPECTLRAHIFVVRNPCTIAVFLYSSNNRGLQQCESNTTRTLLLL
jgi:hypothetical protein